jgi:hypothetical protein
MTFCSAQRKAASPVHSRSEIQAELDSILYLQLLVDVLNMIFDGLPADDEYAGDLLIGNPAATRFTSSSSRAVNFSLIPSRISRSSKV